MNPLTAAIIGLLTGWVTKSTVSSYRENGFKPHVPFEANPRGWQIIHWERPE